MSTIDYGPEVDHWMTYDDPPERGPRHRKARRTRHRATRTARDAARYAAAVLAAGVALVALVILWDVATAHGLFHLPTVPCSL